MGGLGITTVDCGNELHKQENAERQAKLTLQSENVKTRKMFKTY